MPDSPEKFKDEISEEVKNQAKSENIEDDDEE